MVARRPDRSLHDGTPRHRNAVHPTAGRADGPDRNAAGLRGPLLLALVTARPLPRGRGGQALHLYDFETRKWTTVFEGGNDYPAWAPDEASVYFWGYATGRGQRNDVYRLWLADRRLERVWSSVDFVGEGSINEVPWLGLAPDGSLLTMRSKTTRAIYAFDWEAP